MPTEVRDATPEEKLHYFLDRIGELAEKLEIETFVGTVYAHNLEASVRWPTCGSDCPHPDSCAVRVYRAAAESLLDMSRKIEKGEEP